MPCSYGNDSKILKNINIFAKIIVWRINPAQKVLLVGGIIPPTAIDYLTIRLHSASREGAWLHQRHLLCGVKKN